MKIDKFYRSSFIIKFTGKGKLILLLLKSG